MLNKKNIAFQQAVSHVNFFKEKNGIFHGFRLKFFFISSPLHNKNSEEILLCSIFDGLIFRNLVQICQKCVGKFLIYLFTKIKPHQNEGERSLSSVIQ